MAPQPSWRSLAWVSADFAAKYATLSPPYQQLVCDAFVGMARRFANSPSQLGEHFDRVHYLGKHVYELDLKRDDRGLVEVCDDRLILQCVGGHDMILRRQVTPAQLRKFNQSDPVQLDEAVTASVLATASKRRGTSHLLAHDSRWVYQLDDEQSSVVDKLFAAVHDRRNGNRRGLVTGGPGTGKTAILTQLGAVLDWDARFVAFVLSDPVAEFLASGLGTDFLRCRIDIDELRSQKVVLVDDPPSWHTIEKAFDYSRHLGAWLTVVATDLAQVQNVVSDQALKVFLGSKGIKSYQLNSCYRQTQEVGEVSRRFLRFISTRFTKHISQDRAKDFAKQHKRSVETANDMQFVVPGGFSQVKPGASLTDVEQELEGLSASVLWKHWSPICLVKEESITGTKRIEQHVKRLGGHVVPLTDTDSIRGVEYQHVLVLLTRQTLNQIMVTGRSGLSTADYLAARNMRIPFSRATDGLSVFGLDH